jgi:hypothetical protein
MNAFAKRGKALRLAATMVLGALLLAGCSDCTLPPPTMEGTWSGVVSDTYFCEGVSSTIEIEITGTDILVTGGSAFTVGTTGTLANQAGEAYTVALDLATAGEGQLYVDPTMTYALLIVHPSDFGADYVLGVLQKGSLGAISFVENDLVGTWEGVEFRVDAGLGVTSTSASSATVSDPSGTLALSDGTVGVYESFSGSVDWPGPVSRYALGTMSADKQFFAVAFMTSLCEYELNLVLPDQKFTVWVRQ